ncbi:G-patch domain and KOW motifs-containing protein isoform X1 [Folsomia candida]|uniref:G-patch domain and KOW motifs-containing protein isoform X1 n=2 Tax=Folsomia candida TaxID=158441 RepID=UPI000B9036D2|nr:G-patch domain and KOW motifs-containing protein isoform X1 [Folsomia candida]
MISIKFSKTKGPSRVLKDSKLRDDSTRDLDEETDFVTSVDKRQIHGTKKKEVKLPLVIPLITKNEWRMDMDRRAEEAAAAAAAKSTEDKPAVKKEDVKLSLEDQAIQELLGVSANNKVEDDPEHIPLLLQNQVPKGFEEEENMDVSLRPEMSTLEDYEKIPIEEFGMAMLRGMGWSKTEGIGLKNKQHIEIVEPQLRPKGLGLGATISTQVQNGIQNSSGPASGKDKKEELLFKIGAGACIQRGADKGMYGRVEAFDEDNNRVVIKLAINGKMSTVSKFHIVLVTESDYKGKSKVLNYDQYSEYKEIHDAKDKDRMNREAAEREVAAAASSSSSDKRRSKHKSSKRDDDYYNSSHKSSHHSSSKSRNWVRPHLKVRFIDKKYKHGKYYEKKFVVEDVIGHDRFILRSDGGGSTFLEDITTSQVETVIPKQTGAAVCILEGRQKGRIGELVERNRSQEVAIVKIPDGAVVELSYDDICEFVGDPEDYY